MSQKVPQYFIELENRVDKRFETVQQMFNDFRVEMHEYLTTLNRNTEMYMTTLVDRYIGALKETRDEKIDGVIDGLTTERHRIDRHEVRITDLENQ